MVRVLHRLAAFLLVCAGMIAFAAPVAAIAGPARACFAAASPEGSATQAIARVQVWDCAPHAATVAADRVVVRLPMRDSDGHPAAFVRAGIGGFSALTLVAIDANGSVRTLRYGVDEVTPLVGQPQFTAPPATSRATIRLLCRARGRD